MPGMNGIEFLRELRAAGDRRECPARPGDRGAAEIGVSALVVDDDDVDRQRVTRFLAKNGNRAGDDFPGLSLPAA